MKPFLLLVLALGLGACAAEPDADEGRWTEIKPADAVVQFVAPPGEPIVMRTMAIQAQWVYGESATMRVGPNFASISYQETRGGGVVAGRDVFQTLSRVHYFKGETIERGETVPVNAPTVDQYTRFNVAEAKCAGFGREWSPSVDPMRRLAGFERTMVGFICAPPGQNLATEAIVDFLARLGIQRREMPPASLRNKPLVVS